MDWLRSVGKTIIFELDGSKDDDGVSVYPQIVATSIIHVIVVYNNPKIYITPIVPRGDHTIEPGISCLEVRDNKLCIGVEIETEQNFALTLSITGHVIEVY